MDLQFNNSTKNFLFIYCFILLLFNITADEYRVIYSSSRNDLFNYKRFHVNSSYDGSLVIMIIDDHNDNRYKAIHTLLPNGSVSYFDLDFSDKDKNINVSRVFPLNKKLYFLLYDDIVDSYEQITGMLIDWNKQIIKDNIFVADGTIEKNPSLDLVLDLVLDTRLSYFLIYSQFKRVISWSLYNLQKETNINLVANNSFELSNNSTLKSVFPIVNGGYGFVTIEILYDNSSSISNISVPNAYLYYKFLVPTTHKISEKFLLYYARNVDTILYVSCSSSYSVDGNVCMITALIEKSQNISMIVTYQIDFLSSGSIIGLKQRYLQKVNITTNYINSYFNIKPLFYGGSIVTSWVASCINHLCEVSHIGNCRCRHSLFYNLSGHIISINGSEKEWDLNPILNFISATFDIMKNNTYILYVLYKPGNWSIFSIDLTKFREDFGYENPNIISVYPNINNTISPYTNVINITFSNPIIKSSSNLSIYQTNETTKQFKLRKFYSGNSEDCNILNNTNTISCNISPSIFNQLNSFYTIVVDNGFMRYALTDEPIYGIVENLWTFKTNS
ncbi:10975_t:CDS:2, partial [Racocetra persica]